MLKALELSGFKSFADKTRFEFPAGITVVVGPNGSGKSNIVDAIKWVLGEQSAKSLRGKEMADVIFKGSGGPNGRKPANSATATIVLDNCDRRFSFDADEVLVSRRVYRSGEGEYLINNESCRLKDIREMFRGTGIGTDAYSLIEQGKVDRLLQASAKERRAIFEEAAGISRFKAKKIEAQRRLDRVQGNLIRLSDIVEEVGNRYRSVKNQAAKAAKYKEYSSRLRELRTFVGLKDWRQSSEKLFAIESKSQELNASAENFRGEIVELQKNVDVFESQLEAISAEISEKQQLALRQREQIAEKKALISLNQTRISDLERRQLDYENQSIRLKERSDEFDNRRISLQSELDQIESSYNDNHNEVANLQDDIKRMDDQLTQLIDSIEDNQSEAQELSARINEIGRQRIAADLELKSTSSQKSQSERLLAELAATMSECQQKLNAFSETRLALERDAENKNSDLAAAKENLQKSVILQAELRRKQSELRDTLTEKSQRRKVLSELEKKLEGVNAGAKQLLEQAKKSDSRHYREIIGMVADLLSVNVQHAGIVDVALGNAAQYLVVDGSELIDLLKREKLRVKGRVGLLQFNDPPTLGADPNVSINGEPGVIGRADRLVQVRSEFAPFVRKLLGGTWIVKSLENALVIHERGLGQVRMVTLDGEIIEADGTIIVGPKASATGLVSRRSELRLLAKETEELAAELEQTSGELAHANGKVERFNQLVESLINEHGQLAQQLAEIAARVEGTEKQLTDVGSRHQKTDQIIVELLSAISGLETGLSEKNVLLKEKEKRAVEVNQLLADREAEVSKIRAERLSAEQKLTNAKVELAKSEQQLTAYRQQQKQILEELNSLAQENERNKLQISQDQESLRQSGEIVTVAQGELESLQQDLAEISARLETVESEKNTTDEQRRGVAGQLQSRRVELREIEDELHKLELKTGHLELERQKLAERLQEDYGIDIAEFESEPVESEELQKRAEIDEEIATLRKKIGAIGSVNMEALSELEDLEQRYTTMDEQYQDLVAAKQSLENIIQRINSDSRKLFVETLEAIRSNFQTLYRQTFGGGKADILLGEGVDPLESGVEIVATPPGKPEFSNSLLSGGEKALTAVSLLMAIFQFRPSPFCVLDEVDAPFDEANIGRFIDVLKSFLGWTKFVIVTHSKKTMTAATTLYGVTMQESGVSKRVSVRFEDVGEDGQISRAAVERQDDEERGVA